MTTDKNKQIELKLFIGFPGNFLESEGVASALQSFETAIYCVALRRWPATVELVWQASELLLRHMYKKELKEWSSVDAINMHLDRGKVSPALSAAAQSLRRKRNGFVHSGFSPKDDYLSIKTFFGAGVPYFANLLESAFGQDLYNYTGTGTTGTWFWDVYKSTRKLVTDADSNEQNSISRTLLFVLSCQKIVSVGGRFEGALQPYNHYEYLLENNYQDMIYEINKEIIKEFLLSNFGSDSHEIAWLKGDCYICEFELMGKCDWNENDQFSGVKEFGCAKCGYVFKDEKESKAFISSRAFEGQKEIKMAEVEFVEDRLSFF